MQEIINDNEVNKKMMLVCPFKDGQTGLYIRNAFVQNKCPVAPWDWREELKLGHDYMNQKLISDTERLKPDFMLVAKGIGITSDTVKKLKDITKVYYWMFDHTFGGEPILKFDKYVKAIKEVDTYFTVVRGDVEELQNAGINAKWLPEAASTQFNYPLETNYFEEKKYGADVSFCGSIGIEGYHEDRLAWLDSLMQANFNLKLYGAIDNEKIVPGRILQKHMRTIAINDMHNVVTSASKINLGRSGWPEVDMAMSARTYRVLASKGFHLTNATKGIETMFIPGKHLDTYTSNLDCIRKVKYWLEQDEERNKIAETGYKEILEKHTFHNRIEKILGELK